MSPTQSFIHRKIFAAVLLCSLLPNTALAAVRTWDGGGSDNKWSTAANWSADTVPTATDIALFDGTGKKDATIDAAFGGAVAELRLAAANTGTITVGRSLTVNGNLSLSGGTLRANGGNTVTVKGSWQNSGATFESGTGTVILSGSGTTYVLKETGAFKHLSLDDGLVGHWRFDETDEFAPDSSRLRQTVQRVDGPASESDVAPSQYSNLKSVRFSGQNYAFIWDNGSTDDQSLRPNRVTLSLWMKATSDTEYAALVEKGNWVSYGLWLDSGRVRPMILTQLGFIDDSPSEPVSINSWHHLVMTYDLRTLRLYIDGQLAVSRSLASPIVYSGWEPALSFGAYYANGGGSCCKYSGYLDDVRVYNRALSHSEILALYSGEQGTGSGRYTLGSNLTVNGNLNIYSGTLDASSSNYEITASGSFVNNARFTPNSGTVTLSGIGTHLKMYGTSIYNLAIAASKSAILRAGAVISNALTINSTASLRLNGFTMTGTTATITNAGALTQGTGALIHRNSSISVSPASAAMGTTFAVTVTDADANIDGLVADTVSIGTDSETIVLTETGIATGIFTGTIPTAYGPRVANNGIVDRNDECTFTTGVWYSDPQDPPDSVSTTFVVTGCASSSASTTPTNGGGGARAKARIERGEAPSPISTPSRSAAPATPSSPRTLAIERRINALELKLQEATRSDERQTLERARQTLQRMLKRVQKVRR